MINLNKYLSQIRSYFGFYYQYIGFGILKLFLLSSLVGLMDGLGLAMFIPLIEISTNPEEAGNLELGKFGWLLQLVKSIGLELNLGIIFAVILTFFLLKGLGKFFQMVLLVKYTARMVRTIKLSNAKGLSELNYVEFTKMDLGQMQNLLTQETTKTVSSFKFFSAILQGLGLLIAYLTLAFVSTPQFAVIILFAGAFLQLLFLGVFKRIKKVSTQIVGSHNSHFTLILQMLVNLKYLIATSAAYGYFEMIRNNTIALEKQNVKIGMMQAFTVSIREPLIIAVVIAAVGIQFTFFETELSQIALSLLFFYRGLNAASGLQAAFANFQGVAGSLQNMQHYQKEIKSKRRKGGAVVFEGLKTGIRFKEVSFAYGKKEVLHKINLDIQKNQTVAIVGESGSGKTTLMNILSLLLPPSSGQLLIDGEDAVRLDPATFQRKIGYITQDPVIFQGTIFENVSLWGDPSPENLEKCREALRAAEIADFVQQQPADLQTLVGSNGMSLSGGQKQRISIAREIYKKPELLLMDEATSSLDSTTEQAIQASLNKLKGKHTIVIIAHRLSTVRNADKIVFVQNGAIEESGTFQTLIQNNTDFKKMVELQHL